MAVVVFLAFAAVVFQQATLDEATKGSGVVCSGAAAFLVADVGAG